LTFSKELRKRVTEDGRTIREFSHSNGLSEFTVSAYMDQSRVTIPSVDNMKKISKGLNWDLGDMVRTAGTDRYIEFCEKHGVKPI